MVSNNKKYEHRKYHKVQNSELKEYTKSKIYYNRDLANRAASELTERVHFAKRYYRGKYDSCHAHYMTKLYEPVRNNFDALLSMPLDALAALSKIGAR